jgi:hypothetical protein
MFIEDSEEGRCFFLPLMVINTIHIYTCHICAIEHISYKMFFTWYVHELGDSSLRASKQADVSNRTRGIFTMHSQNLISYLCIYLFIFLKIEEFTNIKRNCKKKFQQMNQSFDVQYS